MADKGKKKSLGRGLDAIFGTDVERFLDDIQNSAEGTSAYGTVGSQVAIDDIRANPYQPRRDFDPAALSELADSIRTHGIFTPLLVRKSVGGYQLIAGERRLRAARQAGLAEVPVIIVDFTEDEMMEIAILENVQRENLNPIEEADAYATLVKNLGYTQEKLALRVGKSREYCANIMRLLKLPESVKTMVVEKKLSMSHVRPLLSLKDDETMEKAAKKILRDGMSVRRAEAYVKTLNGETVAAKPKKKEREKDPLIRDIETRMSRKFATRVSVSDKTVAFAYTDTDDLNRLLELFGCIEESYEDQ